MPFDLKTIRKALRYLRLRPGAAFMLARCLSHNTAGILLTLAGARNVRCNLCGWEGARFEAHPDGARIKYGQRCPSCESSPRYRLFARYLSAQPEFTRGSTVLLEFAPEPCLQRFLRSHFRGTYITVDLRSRLADIHTDLTCMGLRADCADLLLCSHVLEHVPDDMLGLSELKRVLRPGAWGILQVPMVAGLPETIEYGKPNPLEHDHFRRYGDDFPRRIAAAGFLVEAVHAGGFTSSEERERLGLPDIPILLARRSSQRA